jgi:hypothetical protein
MLSGPKRKESKRGSNNNTNFEVKMLSGPKKMK